LRQDFRAAWRGFRRTPGFVAAAVIILGLGIGMSVAMFTVFRTVLLRRLPVIDQDRVVVMWTYREPGIEYAAGTKELAGFRRETRTMRDVAGVAHWPASPTPMLDGDRSISLNRSLVTGNFFELLGVKPVLGRLLRPSDDDVGSLDRAGTGASKVIVLSYSAWQGKFGGDSSIIGRHLIEPFTRWDFTIVGVAPPGLDYPAGAEYWGPIWGGWAGGVSTIAVGRLAAQATLQTARDEYFRVASRLDPQLRYRGVSAKTFTDTVLGNVAPVLLLLMIAVGVLLLIACLNVGNLLLLRASRRAREVAVRRALGAGYADIVRQLLVEALLLATAGGTFGFVLAEAFLRLLVLLAPPQLPRLDNVRLSGAPILTAIGLTSAAVVLFGLTPALLGARTSLASPLRFDSRSGTESRRRRSLRQLLVASQVALAMVMLAGAALLARSLERLQRQNLGYVADHLAILSFSYNAQRQDTLPKLLALGDQLLARLASMPTVTSVTPILIPPLLGPNVWQLRFARDAQTDAEAAAEPAVPVEAAGPDFFRTFGIPIVRGRPFREGDREDAPLVAVVSESVARRFWPGEDPIGKRIRLLPIYGMTGWRTIVGVTRDTHLRSLRETTPTVYLPWHQFTWQTYFAVRSSGDPARLVPLARRLAREVDPQVDLWAGQTMDQLLAEPLAQPRFGTVLMSSFGLSALVLAAIGLFGVMTSIVSDQTREMGIRMALGAMPGDVRRVVLSRALALTIVGGIVGLGAAIATSRLFVNLLFEVSPVDPVALAGAGALLIGVGAIAAYVPARRATRIDPVQALRAD
ncbi:MAG TPA: ABC transporter permease, partial [Gemmatimonadaceae bacterium]|nr:ABC transporter permease [Gemmatimonadaceae bacterium]